MCVQALRPATTISLLIRMVCGVGARFLRYVQEYHEMSISEKIKTNLAYGKELVESGLQGAKEARKTVQESEAQHEIVTVAAQESWQAATIGAVAGALFGVLTDDSKPIRGVIAGSLLGAVVGFGGSFVWKTRPLTSAMAHGAGKRIGRARDKHWLTGHPVNYG